MKKNHQFHLVNPSPWPLIISLIILNYTSMSLMFFNLKSVMCMALNLLLITWIMLAWWRDVQRESTFQGHHTFSVMKSMKYGMILFISSEVLFFTSFFWMFFHHSLAPTHEMGLTWPPMSITVFNPLNIPLMNTIILLSSGVSVTWAHASMCMNNFYNTKKSLITTVLLGIYFSILQFYEYYSSPFCISDSVYGSSFFLTTGFHGLHVIIGTLFLLHILLRLDKMHFSQKHHLGMEMGIWYWHFVDVVWLFLYMTIYWWGS
uniref:Cytochrome c oxidase subunit 3 n=1 Tax=Russelliana solanicola TaxID=2008469 RepID=A0A344A2R5_9HEMI|nr:cytochrome c oxidase subunit III [Russelliana solanicola]AWU49056.1 cytochrome c oxidase subunit 3 [Russelliana solanicola]